VLPDDPLIFLKILFLFILGLVVAFQRGVTVELTPEELSSSLPSVERLFQNGPISE
jgi:hypothetical protein